MKERYTLEIKYDPNPTFLDKRGVVASRVAGIKFPDWKIGKDFIVFSNQSKKKSEGLISYERLVYNTAEGRDVFIEDTSEFIKSSWEYLQVNQIKRIGIRTTIVNDGFVFSESFKKLQKVFYSDYDFSKIFNGDLIDLAIPVNFLKGDEYCNVIIGPVKEDENKKEFFDEPLSEPGILVDVDYFINDIPTGLRQKDLIIFVKKAVEESEEINSKVLKIINS